MFYDNPSPFSQHLNIAIKNVGGLIATVGENVPSGIRVFNHTKSKNSWDHWLYRLPRKRLETSLIGQEYP